MQFSTNHTILFVLVGVIIAAVLAQSVFFLVKAYMRAKEKGMDMQKIHKTMLTAAIFTIAPAVSIVITILALSKPLGLALPWLRLSVVGSLSYETIAAAGAASGMGETLDSLTTKMTASAYMNIAIVMTLSIMVGIWLVPLLARKMQKGLVSFEKKDKKWSDILQSSLFIGMISAFVGYVFSDVGRLWLAKDGVYTKVTEDPTTKQTITEVFSATSGLIPVCVMGVSMVCMLLCGLAMKKLGWKWLNDYALPICMLVGMASAIPFTAWLG